MISDRVNGFFVYFSLINQINCISVIRKKYLVLSLRESLSIAFIHKPDFCASFNASLIALYRAMMNFYDKLYENNKTSHEIQEIDFIIEMMLRKPWNYRMLVNEMTFLVLSFTKLSRKISDHPPIIRLQP